MKHYGDITKISGYDVEPVDVVTGGSPCQDLSVAGKREGLAGERSGLFMEQMSDTLGILYELRACYSRFDERQAPYYRALSEAIETMHNLSKQRKGGEMRLIDADALLDRIPNPYEQAHVARWVNEEPTVSAEPKIIRCEYCAHRNQYRFPPKYEVRDYCEVHEKVTTLTNFCSWAERRTDETD